MKWLIATIVGSSKHFGGDGQCQQEARSAVISAACQQRAELALQLLAWQEACAAVCLPVQFLDSCQDKL